jgi:competence protein ComEA
LPGIGPALARRIIEGRPYRSVDDLERVKGIGKRRLAGLRPLVVVR